MIVNNNIKDLIIKDLKSKDLCLMDFQSIFFQEVNKKYKSFYKLHNSKYKNHTDTITNLEEFIVLCSELNNRPIIDILNNKIIKKDLSSVGVGINEVALKRNVFNIDGDIGFKDDTAELLGFVKLYSGVNIFGCLVREDEDEIPIFIAIYYDGKKLRGYIPTSGNTFNSEDNIAINIDDHIEYIDRIKTERNIKDINIIIDIDWELIEQDLVNSISIIQ